MRAVGDIARFRNSLRKPVTASDRRPGPYPYYGAATIQDWVHDYLFEGLHVLVGEDGTVQTSDGRPLVQLVEGKFWVNNHAHVLHCETDSDTRFLAYSLNQVQIAAYVTGAAQPKLNMGNLKRALVHWPDEAVRSEVASIGQCIDERVENLRRSSAALEAIAQALFKSWFMDFDPVRAKAEGREPEGMDAATAALFPSDFEDSELGPIPRGWRAGFLRDICRNHDSKRVPLSGAQREKRRGSYPYYGAASVMDYVDDYIFDGVYVLLAEDGSVATKTGFALTQYVFGRFWVNNHAHVLEGANGYSTEQLLLMLQRVQIGEFVTGAVQAKLSQSNMFRIPVIIPARTVLDAFTGLAQPLFAVIRSNSERQKALVELRDTLLPRLISGKLRLPEAEAMMDELPEVSEVA